MAIIEDRLSTTVVEDIYLDPDGRTRTLNTDFEDGPIAVTDMSEGSQYQPWRLTFSSGDFIVTPEITGSPVVILSGQDSIYCSFTFDKNGRPSIFWKDSANLCYLYWYDSTVAMFVTTDYFDVFHGMLSLDDKRVMESAASDVLLWYTRLVAGPQYNLYHKKQRDRYTIEHLMEEDISPYIYKAGMHEGLRGQLVLGQSQIAVIPATLPPGPFAEQANLDFEFGDTYWTKVLDFVINQADPFGGSWSATLNTNPANYSTLENNVYTLIVTTILTQQGNTILDRSGNIIISRSTATPERFLPISCMVKGSIATSITLGFKFYNEIKSLIATETVSKNVSVIWARISYSILIPINAAYYRIFVESDATDGIVSLDNFSVISLLDVYDVNLDSLANYSVELDTIELFEINA